MNWLMVLALVLIVLFAYSFIEPYLVRVKEYTVTDARIPAGFDGKNIVFISDIHCSSYVPIERVKGMVEKANNLKPDLILLGGDYTTMSKDLIEPCIRELAGLEAPLGVHGVLGNHDNWNNNSLTRESLTGAGVNILDNRAAWIESAGSRIRVGGVGDLWTDTQDLEPTLENTSSKDFIILLSHNPQYAENSDTSRIGLMLSGHTHGGQILPFQLLSRFMPSRMGHKYVSGLYEKEDTTIIVTNGFGVIFIPNRFLVPPEIVRITLKKG